MARVPSVLTAVLVLAGLAGCGGADSGPILAGGREVKAWVADLHDSNPRVRRQAVLKLGNVGDADPEVAPALAEALRDPDPIVRRDAILAVVKLKNPGPEIQDQLSTMSRGDKDPRAKDLARKAVERAGNGE